MDNKVSPQVSIYKDFPIENYDDKYDVVIRPSGPFNRKKVNKVGNMPSADFSVPAIPKQTTRKGVRYK